jgi:hypothetical protein
MTGSSQPWRPRYARLNFVLEADVVIAIDIVIDTIDERAGISIWTRRNIERCRLLRQD